MKPNNQSYIINCNSCGSSQLNLYLKTKDFFLTQEVFDLIKCEACGLIMTNPVPTQDEMNKYYDSPEYLSHATSKKSVKSILYNTLRQINIKKKYRFINSFNTDKDILDYGCGSGHFLHFFQQKGWKISGIEPNENARRAASFLNNTKILSNQEMDLFPTKSFDVITLWHVLEHVYNLNEILQKLISLLNDKGILVIAVPNIYSPDAIKYGEYWAGLDVPRHLYHFSIHSMKNFLSKHLMDVILTKPMMFDAFYVSLLSETYKGRKFPYLNALLAGWNSNKEAKKSNNYSSMIFVARPK